MSPFLSSLMGGQKAEAEGMIQGKQGGKRAEIMGFNLGINAIQKLQKPERLHKRYSSRRFQIGKGFLRNRGGRVFKAGKRKLGAKIRNS